MSADALHTLQVVTSAEEEVAATYADLAVTVKGSSLFSAQVALSKAREVASLVAALKAVGVDEKDVRLTNITAEVTNGLLSKTSSATYALEIRCRVLDTLPDLLGAITSQKTAELSSIDWGFPDEHTQRSRLLAECARKANERAKLLADTLGVALAGVHRFVELTPGVRFEGYAEPPQAYGGGAPMSKMRRSMSAADLGLAITHTKRVEVRAVAEFLVKSA